MAPESVLMLENSLTFGIGYENLVSVSVLRLLFLNPSIMSLLLQKSVIRVDLVLVLGEKAAAVRQLNVALFLLL